MAAPKTPGITEPFPEDEPFTRRDFLEMAGFSLAAGLLGAGCRRAPVIQALPFVVPAEGIAPGEAVWTTAVCGACTAGCGILVKNRDGRPVKLEGNPRHPVNRGGLCAAGQASLLGLFDERRLGAPVIRGATATWGEFDRQVREKLQGIVQRSGKVVVLTRTVTSPTLQSMLDRFRSLYPGTEHIAYDPLPVSAIPDAHLSTFGVRVLPRYRFERARAIAAFEADFLGTWLSPVQFAADYATGRDPDRSSPADMSWHLQVESRLSLTGAKADDRLALPPQGVELLLAHLAQDIAQRRGHLLPIAVPAPPVPSEEVKRIADLLWQHRGRSLCVAGINTFRIQVLINVLNFHLDAYGNTVDLSRPSRQHLGDDCALRRLAADLRQGRVDGLIVWGVNPVYDLPEGDELARIIADLPLSVDITPRLDETTQVATFVAAESHPLESWGDSEPLEGVFSVSQPAHPRFGDTRSAVEVFAAWCGDHPDGQRWVREYWHRHILSRLAGIKSTADFETTWRRILLDGFAETSPPAFPDLSLRVPELSFEDFRTPPSGPALVLHPTPAMLDGSLAYNPFLFELPDPVTKVTWDNTLQLSPTTANRLGVQDGDVVRLGKSGREVELPAAIVEGHPDDVAAAAIGFGRTESARFAHIGPRWLFARESTNSDGTVGVNLSPLVEWRGDHRCWTVESINLEPSGIRKPLARTQEYFDLQVRDRLLPKGAHSEPVVVATDLDTYRQQGLTGAPADRREGDDLWSEDHPSPGYRWALVVDLNLCTGCSACITACNLENNIPVVGRDEVYRNREMHWLRIDRYLSRRNDRLEFTFMPMMCQQCAHAPCETVCPVLATVHSEEGLNQQVYNRCVGTRYCANNCPYKVRRFNWFNYPYARTGRERLILNPDVTVRTRGVMEKCTFCVQRIMAGKARAKTEGRPVADGEIAPACVQSCPTRALTFGDWNNPESQVARLMNHPRRYYVLSELNVRPAVGYLAVVRNPQLEPGRNPATGESGGAKHV